MIARPLSPRQAEIAHLLDDGLTQQQVADRLGISVRTVWHHTERIRAKTGQTTTAAAVSHARVRGLARRSSPPVENSQ